MLMLVLSLLLQAMAIPTFAQEGREIAADAPVSAASQDIGSDEYRSRFTADAWTSVGDAGVLMQNTSEGIRMDITGRGAALGATLLAYDGQTSCNALRFVLENRSACTEMQLRVPASFDDLQACRKYMPNYSEPSAYSDALLPEAYKGSCISSHKSEMSFGIRRDFRKRMQDCAEMQSFPDASLPEAYALDHTTSR